MSASTANRGYTYPTSGDPNKPRLDIQGLAEDVDTDMAAQVVAIGGLAALNQMAVRKGGDTTRASTTSATADPALKLAVPDGQKWYILDMMVVYAADAAGDIKVGLYGPTGWTFRGSYMGQPAAASAVAGSVTMDAQSAGPVTFGGIGTGTDLVVRVRGIFRSGTVAGDMGLTWAQGSSSGTGTIVRSDSYIMLTPAPF